MWPHRRQPTRLPRPWDSPGKNTGVGCHFLLQWVKVKLLSQVWLLATPWTAAYQAPPSMGFSRQEYWSGGCHCLLHQSSQFTLKNSLWMLYIHSTDLGFPGGAVVKESACQHKRWKRCGFNPWVRKIPWSRKWQPSPISWTEEPGGLQSRGSQGVGHNRATHTKTPMNESSCCPTTRPKLRIVYVPIFGHSNRCVIVLSKLMSSAL